MRPQDVSYDPGKVTATPLDTTAPGNASRAEVSAVYVESEKRDDATPSWSRYVRVNGEWWVDVRTAKTNCQS